MMTKYGAQYNRATTPLLEPSQNRQHIDDEGLRRPREDSPDSGSNLSPNILTPPSPLAGVDADDVAGRPYLRTERTFGNQRRIQPQPVTHANAHLVQVRSQWQEFILPASPATFIGVAVAAVASYIVVVWLFGGLPSDRKLG